MATDTKIAETIIGQLGGQNKLRMMTGAYNFIAHDNGVSFKIKNAKANYIKILVTGMDLYDLEIGRIRGATYKVVNKSEGVYADMLRPIIERVTGMYLSLYKTGGNTSEKVALKHFEGLYLVETTNGYLVDNRGLVDKYEPKNKTKLQEATNHFNRVVKLIKQSRYGNGGGLDGVVNNNFENKLWDNLQTRSMGFEKGTTIDTESSLFYNKENFDDETVLCVSKLYGCIIWRDSLGRLMKVDNISNPTKMYFIDNGQVIGRIRLSYLKNKCIIESFWLNGTSSDKLIYCDKMLKKIASHINTDLLVVYANNLNDNILKKILIDFGFKETASKELHFECNGSCGKGFAKGTTIEGKPRKKYIIWRAKDSYSSREIIAESDTSIGANQILSKREKKGEFEGYSNWGYDNTQDYFFHKGQYANYEKGSKPSGGGIDLVHVYDENGEMYGTGELVEVKGNKTVVRFDAMDTREFDSDRVKPVMENGGKIKNWEYSIGGL